MTTDDGADLTAEGVLSAAEVERACEVMHDAYEAAAVTEGWETQERSRKPWRDVPEANKATMRTAVRALLAARAAADEEVRGRLAAALERQLEWAAAVAASPTGWTAPEVVRHLSGRIRAVLETLDASTTEPVRAENARLREQVAALEVECDEWKRRRDNAVETCRFRHQDGLTAREWHLRICGAAQRLAAIEALRDDLMNPGAPQVAGWKRQAAKMIAAALDAPTATQPEQGGASVESAADERKP